tara:strand:- start:205 stop:1467 length:1263 start_codon:yes stop_codon:yes gene_type:complete
MWVLFCGRCYKKKEREMAAQVEVISGVHEETTSLTPFETKVPTSFFCPILLRLMTDPIRIQWGGMLPTQSHAYDRESLEKWIQTSELAGNKNPLDPITKKPFNKNAITTDDTLRGIIDEFVLENPQLFPEEDLEAYRRHQVTERRRRAERLFQCNTTTSIAQAARLDHPAAIGVLAKTTAFSAGNGFKALDLARKGVTLNDPTGYSHWIIAEYELHVRTNLAEAARLLEISIERNPGAYEPLAFLYFFGGPGLRRNPTHAVKIWKKLVEIEDHPAAAYYVGLCYYHGVEDVDSSILVARDIKHAMTYLEKAAHEHDLLDAVALCGQIYCEGYNNPNGVKGGLRMLCDASDRGSDRARRFIENMVDVYKSNAPGLHEARKAGAECSDEEMGASDDECAGFYWNSVVKVPPAKWNWETMRDA